MMRVNVYADVNKADIKCEDIVTLTSGMEGTKVKFSFSPEWEGLEKVAKFITINGSVEVPIVDDEVEIPKTMLAMPRIELDLGIVGQNTSTHTCIPTTIVKIALIREGATI